MGKRYFQEALQSFNGGNWYGWKKLDADGNLDQTSFTWPTEPS